MESVGAVVGCCAEISLSPSSERGTQCMLLWMVERFFLLFFSFLVFHGRTGECFNLMFRAEN